MVGSIPEVGIVVVVSSPQLHFLVELFHTQLLFLHFLPLLFQRWQISGTQVPEGVVGVVPGLTGAVVGS